MLKNVKKVVDIIGISLYNHKCKVNNANKVTGFEYDDGTQGS